MRRCGNRPGGPVVRHRSGDGSVNAAKQGRTEIAEAGGASPNRNRECRLGAVVARKLKWWCAQSGEKGALLENSLISAKQQGILANVSEIREISAEICS